MKVIGPDFDRTVDLPGVGPTPRPVDIDQGATGFSDIVSLRIYDFDEGVAIDGEAEGDEVLVTLLGGAVTIAVTGPHEAEFTLQADGDWAIYLPPSHRYRLTPLTPSSVAYARARPSRSSAPRSFAPVSGVLAVEEGAERLRLRLMPLLGETDASAGLDAGLERLAHVTAPARVVADGVGHDLGGMDTLVLSPGERAVIEAGSGDPSGAELLVVAAVRPEG